jgi:HD-like signal output (HDOD) protein
MPYGSRDDDGGAPSVVEELLSGLENLHSSRAVCLQAVQVLDAPGSSAADVARVISADPALTSRVLRVANSVYYGMSGRVANPSFAVIVVGFQTVRSLAVVGAAGLGDPQDLPDGFWPQSLATAAACSLVAGRAGVVPGEAFATGLLHDLGSALLRQHDKVLYDQVIALAELKGALPLALLQRRTYGGSAATLGAQVLRAWALPHELTSAIERQGDLLEKTAAPMARTLQAGKVLASMTGPNSEAASWAGARALEAVNLGPHQAKALADQVRAAAAQLEESLLAA